MGVAHAGAAPSTSRRASRSCTPTCPGCGPGRVGAQFWSVYVPCSFTGPDAVATVLEQVALVRELAERYPDDLRLATTAAEAEAALAAGRVASLMGAEGGHGIDGSLDALRELRRRGVRYLTLTHNRNTAVGGLGHRRARARRAHGVRPRGGAGDEPDRHARRPLATSRPRPCATPCATTAAPVVFTHSSCRAVTDHPRNVPDDVLAALPANGGVCMVTFVPQFVSSAARDWDQAVQDDMAGGGARPADLEARPGVPGPARRAAVPARDDRRRRRARRARP